MFQDIIKDQTHDLIIFVRNGSRHAQPRCDWQYKMSRTKVAKNHETFMGAGRSSEVERSLMVRWVVGSILHGVDPLSYFSFQPVLHERCNKGRGMCYPVCGIMHIKEPLLVIGQSSLCDGSGFPLSRSEWSFTICLTPYNRKIKCVECVVK